MPERFRAFKVPVKFWQHLHCSGIMVAYALTSYSQFDSGDADEKMKNELDTGILQWSIGLRGR